MQFFRAFRHAGRLTAALFLLALSLAAVPASSAFAAATTGEQKTAVILVNFQDEATQPISVAAANSLVFGTVSDFYWETSYQKTFLSGDTFGWFTIPVSKTSCVRGTIAAEGNRAATDAGANIASYDRVIYMFPANSGCSWSGVTGTAADGQKQVFINNNFDLYVIAHELGHSFGLLHSDALDCDTGTLGATCIQRGYGDGADTMGSRAAHFDAFQKEQLGWVNVAGAPSITTVSSSGRYTIAPMETLGGVKALKILKSTDPITGQKTWYYVEYRQPIGFDSILSAVGNLTKGVLIRTGTLDGGNFPVSLLLDMTPNSNNTSTISDLKDAALIAGGSYADSAASVGITVVSADASGAIVDVSIGGGSTPAPSCTRAAPAVSLSGATTAVVAGSSKSYTVTVSNKDSDACAATSFALARSVPTGWTGTLAATSLSLSPGSNASTTLIVTSPSTATAGSHGIGVGTSSSAGNVHTANASSTYSVATTTSSPAITETVGTDKSSYLRGQTVTMSARVLSNDVAVNGANVRFNITLPNGSGTVVSATCGSDGYARGSYKLGKGKATIGSYVLRADATSAGQTATASTSFNVR